MMIEKIKEAVAYIRKQTEQEVKTGIILGTGLSGLTKLANITHKIPYAYIQWSPDFVVQAIKKFLFSCFSTLKISPQLLLVLQNINSYVLA